MLGRALIARHERSSERAPGRVRLPLGMRGYSAERDSRSQFYCLPGVDAVRPVRVCLPLGRRGYSCERRA